MHEALKYPFDAGYIMKKRRSIRKELTADEGRKFLEKKIAILGGSTTHDIKETLELFLLDAGIRPTFYESEFAQYWQDAMFSQELRDFAPDLCFIHTSFRNLTSLPVLTDTEAQIAEKADAEFARFRAMWETLRRDLGCPIIQNNFEPPFYRVLGNRDAWDVHGKGRYTAEMNRRFADYAAGHEGFYLHDIAYLAADFGLSAWSDPFFWHMYKYCLSMEAIPAFAHSLSAIICSIWGGRRKVLTLDLDNTLWGGIVGDDGPEHLLIGHETSMGQVYSEFQSYCKELASSGILLTVDSKNDEANALAGLNHPEGTLRPDDFAKIAANWDPKDKNLIETADALHLLTGSFVFADDNPAERAIVSGGVPDAAIAQMDEPEHYVYAIDRAMYFEPADLSGADLERGEMYRANAARERQMAQFENYEDYLKSLEMHAEIAPFAPVYYPRIAQLTNKSNQFNLTTLRCSEPQIEAAAADPDTVTLYGKLTDKYGDNGLISVVMGHVSKDALDLTLWLMSCRVLKRQMEDAMLDAVVKEAKRRGLVRLIGHYYATAKNHMVENFYRDFGFTKTAQNGEDTDWELDISLYENKNRVIDVQEADTTARG